MLFHFRREVRLGSFALTKAHGSVAMSPLLPEAKTSEEGIYVITRTAAWRQFLQLVDVAPAQNNVFGFKSGNQTLDGVSHVTPPFFLSKLLQPPNANVVLEGSFFVRQVSQLHRLNDAVHDHRRPKTC